MELPSPDRRNERGSRMSFTRKSGCLIGFLLLLMGCAPAVQLTTQPIKWSDPDHQPIAEPKEIEENQIWDIVDHTIFYGCSS